MLTRRHLLVSSAVVLAACELAYMSGRHALRSLEVVISPAQIETFLDAMERFARDHGFSFAADTRPSSVGTSRPFEMRRWDIWIEGNNIPKDVPVEVPMGADGRPDIHLEIDETRFSIGLFSALRGSEEPPELPAIYNALSATVRAIPGAVLTES